MIGSVAICARDSTWKVPIVSARHSISNTAGSSFGMVARSTGLPRRRADVQGILDGRQHPEAEQVDLHDADVLAVVLVPLHDGAAGHGGGLERD